MQSLSLQADLVQSDQCDCICHQPKAHLIIHILVHKDCWKTFEQLCPRTIQISPGYPAHCHRSFAYYPRIRYDIISML